MRLKHESAIQSARTFLRAFTLIGFANNGSFQPLQTYNWQGGIDAK